MEYHPSLPFETFPVTVLSQRVSPGPLPHHELGIFLSPACLLLAPKILVLDLHAAGEEFFASQAPNADILMPEWCSKMCYPTRWFSPEMTSALCPLPSALGKQFSLLRGKPVFAGLPPAWLWAPRGQKQRLIHHGIRCSRWQNERLGTVCWMNEWRRWNLVKPVLSEPS